MEQEYVAPSVEVLGTVTDLTQGFRGIYFDFPGSANGAGDPPDPNAPGVGHHIS
jgi:hypothetical protein